MSFVFMGEPMPWPKENNALMPNGTRRTYHRDKATKTRPAGALMAWHRYMQMKATQVSLQEGVYFDRKTPIRITLDVRITRPKSNKDPFPVTKPDGDNYFYSVHNALQGGMIEDDCQIVTNHEQERWANETYPPGIYVTLETETEP